MLTVKENLIEILETYAPEHVFLQGSLNPDIPYPETLITFFITSSDFESFYNNLSNRVDWSISVMIYSVDPDEIDRIAKAVIKDCKAAGFIPQGAGFDLPSDVESHTGWALDFVYPEYITD